VGHMWLWNAKWLCNSWKLCAFCGTRSIGQVGRAGEPIQKATFFWVWDWTLNRITLHGSLLYEGHVPAMQGFCIVKLPCLGK
jgi:hypothetical protein